MIITPAQTCGPLFGFALTPRGITETVPEDHPEAIVIEGTVYDGAGEHVDYGAFLEFWSDEQACRVRTLEGRFRTVVRKPAPVTLADGHTLAPQLGIFIFTRGLSGPLVTKMYFPDETEANAADAILQQVPEHRRPVLVAETTDTERHLRYDIRLQGERESVFFSLD
ncbi:hypothetical protein OED52_14735 [Rhodococcus sp. Z13]|uniref:Uncharacterized protein n=1 Tax=Rhodococcus sacchari TaxID=2962047 RepID=A0ACD4DD35_9NOCA|nr:hypothetical protein [Rhodococcus sp. Z13]UYP17917.1 hypothetical protein OED52_14735 [Rhodococcus sp. Z13]